MSTGTLTRGPGAPAPVQMDPRMAARVNQVAGGRARRQARRRGRVVLVLLVASVLFGLSRSPLVDVDHIEVSGTAHTDPEALAKALGIGRGRAMVSVDESAAENRLRALPWVATATVTTRWPGTVQVRVTERAAVAIAGSGDEVFLVDALGRVLGPAGDDPALPTVSPVVAEPGDLLDGDARRLTAVVAALPPALLAEVAEVSHSGGAVDLELHDGIQVRLGEPTRIRTKGEAVLALLNQADRATIATIDVTVPGAAALTRRAEGGA